MRAPGENNWMIHPLVRGLIEDDSRKKEESLMNKDWLWLVPLLAVVFLAGYGTARRVWRTD